VLWSPWLADVVVVAGIVEKLGHRVGHSAVETMGTVDFDAATSTLTFQGVKVSDPGLIGMDKYRLKASSGLPFLCVPQCSGCTPYCVLLCFVAFQVLLSLVGQTP
jgi:hypothetical protein